MSNKVTSEVPFYDLLQQLKSETMRDLRVCLPGSISAIDPSTGTVSVEIGVMQKVAQRGLPAGLAVSYPMLTMCPVFTIQGGGVGAVMPVEIGDECLVVFSDRCIDSWFSTGSPAPLPSVRMHDISDGFVLVGLNSQQNKLVTSLVPGEGGVCETAASVSGTGAKVAIDPVTHKVTVANAPGATLLTALTTLITALNTLTVNTVTGVIEPSSVTAINVALTQLQALLY